MVNTYGLHAEKFIDPDESADGLHAEKFIDPDESAHKSYIINPRRIARLQ